MGKRRRRTQGRKTPAPPDSDTPEVTIDFDGLADRIIDAPGMGTNDYAGLAPGPAGTVFVLGGGSAARKYSIEDRDAEDFLEQGGRVAISHDRSSMLYYSGGWRIVGTARPAFRRRRPARPGQHARPRRTHRRVCQGCPRAVRRHSTPGRSWF